jgi:hypothetical protein
MTASTTLALGAKVKTRELIAARLSCTLANLSREQSYTEKRSGSCLRLCVRGTTAVESQIKNFKSESKQKAL